MPSILRAPLHTRRPGRLARADTHYNGLVTSTSRMHPMHAKRFSSAKGEHYDAHRHHLCPGRIPAGQRGVPHSPDHPGHDVQVHVERADEPTVRPVRIRLLLHTSAEPDQRHGRRQDLRARRRRGRDAHQLRPGGELLRPVQHLQRGRPYRGLVRDLRRHVQPHQRDDAQDGHRMHVREPRLHARGAGRRVPAEHQRPCSANPSPTRRSSCWTSTSSPPPRTTTAYR